MSIKTLLVALLALVFGGSAAAVVVLVAPRSGGQAKEDTVPLVVASVDVGRGVVITDEMVQVRPWPKAMAPAGAIGDLKEVVGKTSRTSVLIGEPILTGKLAEGRGLHALVGPGMRAYTIQTPSVSAGVGGFIRPEDRVDVILTVTSAMAGDERRTGGGIATVLLQNVEVLAAGTHLQEETEESATKITGGVLTSVTLLVTPRQAQELTLAQTKGTLNLALRRDEDNADAAPAPLYLSDLPFLREGPNPDGDESEGTSGVVEPAAPEPVVTPVSTVVAAPPPKRMEIRTYRGLTTGAVIVEMKKKNL